MENNENNNSIVPIKSNSLVRVINSINITNKLLGILTTTEFEHFYNVVEIDGVKYMTRNLIERKFRNGDIITEACSAEEWFYCAQNQIPAYCSYENNPKNDIIFGKLYNFYCISDARGIAPDGWEIINDFPNKFETFELMSQNNWNIKVYTQYQEGIKQDLVNYSKNNDFSQFNSIPAGMRHMSGLFEGKNFFFHCWTNHSTYNKSDLKNLNPMDIIDSLKISESTVRGGINLGMGWLGSKRHSVANCGCGLSIRYVKYNGSNI